MIFNYSDKAPDKLTNKMKAAIKSLQRSELDTALLQDKYAQRILQKVDNKLKKNVDVVRSEAPEDVDYDNDGESADNVIDLMQVLKQRLQGKQVEQSDSSKKSTDSHRKTESPRKKRKEQGENSEASNDKSTKPAKNGKPSNNSTKTKMKGNSSDLQTLPRNQLYEQAKQQSIAGRSNMSKHELVRALS